MALSTRRLVLFVVELVETWISSASLADPTAVISTSSCAISSTMLLR